MIFITGDIHGQIDIRKLSSKNFPEGKNLTKDDYVIICGDFGLIWNLDDEDKYWLKWLQSKPWTTLFCDGNHENFNLLEQFPEEERFGGRVHVINDSVFHLMRGYVFNIDGNSFFVMGGAPSYDRAHRKENISWWRREIPSREEFERGLNNLDAVNWEVDYVISHTGPFSIVKMTNYYMKLDDVSNYLDIIKDRLKFKHWYLGHMHCDMTIDKFTFVYNQFRKIEKIVLNRADNEICKTINKKDKSKPLFP